MTKSDQMKMIEKINSNNPYEVHIDRFPSVINTDYNRVLLSDDYGFISSLEVASMLADMGWYPSEIKEAHHRIVEYKATSKHEIRFRNPKFNSIVEIDQVFPELIWHNSLDGTAKGKFLGGIYRYICGNGMYVSENTYGIFEIKHRKFARSYIDDAVRNIGTQVPIIASQVKNLSSITLSKEQQLEYAREAAAVRWAEKYVPEEILLAPQRKEDELPTLWNKYNIIQEKIVRGGVPVHKITEAGEPEEKGRKAKALKSIPEDAKFNQRLWELTSEFAKKVTA